MKPKDIKKLRQSSFGETQAQFAARVGVRRATVSDWERGKKPSPMAETLLGMIARREKSSRKMSTVRPRPPRPGTETSYTDWAALFFT